MKVGWLLFQVDFPDKEEPWDLVALLDADQESPWNPDLGLLGFEQDKDGQVMVATNSLRGDLKPNLAEDGGSLKIVMADGWVGDYQPPFVAPYPGDPIYREEGVVIRSGVQWKADRINQAVANLSFCSDFFAQETSREAGQEASVGDIGTTDDDPAL